MRKYRIQNNYENFKTSNDCGVNCQFREEVVYAGANNGIYICLKQQSMEKSFGDLYLLPSWKTFQEFHRIKRMLLIQFME